MGFVNLNCVSLFLTVSEYEVPILDFPTGGFKGGGGGHTKLGAHNDFWPGDVNEEDRPGAHVY